MHSVYLLNVAVTIMTFSGDDIHIVFIGDIYYR